MSIQAAREQFSIWKMAILKVALMTLVTGFTTLQTSLNGLEWNILTGTQKVMLICGVCVAMASTVISFLDRSMSHIEAQQKEIHTGNTDFLAKNPVDNQPKV